MPRKLFPHQHMGADFLAERDHAGLFFGMGTGKTLTSLEAAKRAGVTRLVIVGPPISLPMWAKEAKAWLGDDHDAYILKTGKFPLTDVAPKTTVVVSYAIAATRAGELGEWLSLGTKSAVIFDESHALKNVKAKRTKALLGRGGMTDGTVDHCWFLTGTPITRWNDDMYPFLARADRETMKEKCGGVTPERFARKFTVQQQKQYSKRMRPAWVTVSNRNTQELADWTYGGGHALRVDLDEVYKDMPPITINRYTVGLDSSQLNAAMLKAIKGMSVAEIQERGQKDPELATIRRALGMAMVRDAVKEIAERIESGQNVLIGAWHTDVIDAIAKQLRAHKCTTSGGVAIIDGRASSAKKQQAERYWNEGHLQALVCQIGAAGVSLNLQKGGSQIVVVEEDWSPTIMDQFYARLWRYGQEKHVHVDILTADTNLHKALAKIASAKAAQAEKHNEIGREYTAKLEETTT